jgi:hypothetical protein
MNNATNAMIKTQYRHCRRISTDFKRNDRISC